MDCYSERASLSPGYPELGDRNTNDSIVSLDDDCSSHVLLAAFDVSEAAHEAHPVIGNCAMALLKTLTEEDPPTYANIFENLPVHPACVLSFQS
jgi:hypothetical protein